MNPIEMLKHNVIGNLNNIELFKYIENDGKIFKIVKENEGKINRLSITIGTIEESNTYYCTESESIKDISNFIEGLLKEFGFRIGDIKYIIKSELIKIKEYDIDSNNLIKSLVECSLLYNYNPIIRDFRNSVNFYEEDKDLKEGNDVKMFNQNSDCVNNTIENNHNNRIERMCKGIDNNYQVFGFSYFEVQVWGQIKRDKSMSFTFTDDNELVIELSFKEITNIGKIDKNFYRICDSFKINHKDINKRLIDDMRLQIPEEIYSRIESDLNTESVFTKMVRCMIVYGNKGVDWD